ncbi:sortilin [Bombina bombina]|uniref:sortilin n=1 Tax=Bombina bombina TaxID=8345 RepID=UPI00235AB32E|nr:sortilin [Bombina bombina]
MGFSVENRTGLFGLFLLVIVGLSQAAFPLDLLDAKPVLPRIRRSLETSSPGPASDGKCRNQKDIDGLLSKDTSTCSFDLSGELSLVWIGDGTGVILVLTTFRLPLLVITYAQSRLYRSADYGKTFQEITSQINNTYIRTEFGMGVGPENSGKVILIAEVSGGSLGGRIFRSSDFAKTFVQTDLPFHPLVPVTYNPVNSNYLLLLSIDYVLWISKNFGETWNEIHPSVCSAKWGVGDTILFTTAVNATCREDYRSLSLKKTSDFGSTFKTVGERVHSFGLWGRFLLASVLEQDRTKRRIHVSQDQGETWNVAQLPSVKYEQFYSVLAASDDMVFIHVDDEGDTGCGTIYTSDDRGIVYSKSLERHLYTMTGGETDFTNVTSLNGVYITSVLSEDNSIRSVITFDQGGEWSPLRKPENTNCDLTAKDKEQCSLHIHAQYSISQRLTVPMPPLSEPNAVGLVIAHGSVGDAVSISRPAVYLSDDGGYSWSKVLDGPHHYAILDSGGLIVAVEQSDEPINTVKFSTDEGQCWYSYNFSKEPVTFIGLATEPGARSLNVTVWGHQPGLFRNIWKSYTIDFISLLQQNCKDLDYIKWLAHSTDPGVSEDGCVLGYKREYLRLRKSSMCQNGRNYSVTRAHILCTCTLDDYMCDFGYYRKENDSTCVEQPELRGHELELCVFGEEEQLKTKGYRKIPGDKCINGINPMREETSMKRKCANDFLVPSVPSKVSSSTTVPVIISVVVVLLCAIVAAVLIIKKYVCGGRFLVHRYSVLRQHMDPQGDEQLDTSIGETRRGGGFHDDSDDDLLE